MFFKQEQTLALQEDKAVGLNFHCISDAKNMFWKLKNIVESVLAKNYDDIKQKIIDLRPSFEKMASDCSLGTFNYNLKFNLMNCIKDLDAGYEDIKKLIDGVEEKTVEQIIEEVKGLSPLVEKLEGDCK